MHELTKIPLLLIFGLLAIFGNAQDIHWSQFNDNPIFQNPGNAGHFDGDLRFVGNYRNQWRSVTVPFSTLSASADAQMKFNRNIGIGGLIFHDVVGDGQFRTVELQANVSFLLKLSADSVHTLRPGVNVGLNHRQFNTDKFYFDNQFNGLQFMPSLSTGEIFQSDRKSNLSLGAGTIYQYYRNDRFNFTGGVGFFNLNQPNQGFFLTRIQRDIRMNLFGKGICRLNNNWDLVPGMQVNIQGKYREIIIGSSAKYTLINRSGEYRALYGGFFYRNRDATYISAGMDYQAWFFGVSYDINFSKLVPASNLRGGVEVAVRYIISRFNPKKAVHRICPDFI